jgi:hypothetical protein
MSILVSSQPTGRVQIWWRSNSKSLVAHHLYRAVCRQSSDNLSYLASRNEVCRSQKCFWYLSSTSTWRFLKSCHHGVIIALRGYMKAQNIFLRPQNKSVRSAMKYDHFFVFIRQYSAEIWGFRYGITLGLGTGNMASTVVLGLLVCPLNSANKDFLCPLRTILAHKRNMRNRCSQKYGPIRNFYQVRHRASNPLRARLTELLYCCSQKKERWS